mmetsp:Transcript_21525/g.53854  ORF Transcript_21525/g.53854 Transcript_21525/m.53854 type:complete len:487 (-) Transcript_21525:94-1554(-)
MASIAVTSVFFWLAVSGMSEALTATHTAGKSMLEHSLHVATGREAEHYWTSRGGDMMTRSYVPYEVPSNFSSGPAWIWPNELKEQIRHSPLIDADMNIYISSTTRIRKLSSEGDLLWTVKIDGKFVTCPTLVGGELLALESHSRSGEDSWYPILMSIDIQSGALNWNRSYEEYSVGSEANSVSSYNGTTFFIVTKESFQPSAVVAANSSDGNLLWEYQLDEAVWNFAPASPGDGTLLMGGSCGSVWRLSFAGELLWRAGPAPLEKDATCGTSGGALGPNGIFYNAYSRTTIPFVKAEGIISAHRVSDGSLLWEKKMPVRASQYPAVGQLGPDGKLFVALPLGDNPFPPLVPEKAEEALVAEVLGPLRNVVYTLDAATGDVLWQSEEEPYNLLTAAGEREQHNPDDGSICLPDSQGIPLIAGDGTVFASSSHTGQLRAMKDKNSDGVIDASEVSIFETHECFLNSPSAAPGMLVAAPCWGPVYVFKA